MCREPFDFYAMAADLEPDINRLEKRIAELAGDPLKHGTKCGYEELLVELKSKRKALLEKAGRREHETN